jgi:uncharacterized protein
LVEEVALVRVVLDTNVVVSALLFGGQKWQWLQDAWTWERILPLASRKTYLELLRVLSYPKFRLEPDEQSVLIGLYLPHVCVVPDPRPLPGRPICRDPFDQVFIDLALEGNAEFLVSGDSDLLDYPAPPGLRIIRPSELREKLKEA